MPLLTRDYISYSRIALQSPLDSIQLSPDFHLVLGQWALCEVWNILGIHKTEHLRTLSYNLYSNSIASYRQSCLKSYRIIVTYRMLVTFLLGGNEMRGWVHHQLTQRLPPPLLQSGGEGNDEVFRISEFPSCPLPHHSYVWRMLTIPRVFEYFDS